MRCEAGFGGSFLCGGGGAPLRVVYKAPLDSGLNFKAHDAFGKALFVAAVILPLCTARVN